MGFDRLPDLVSRTSLSLAVLWLGLASLTLSLLVLMYTRWGQLHPLRKSIILSLLAHVLVLGYSATVYIAPSMSLFQDDVMRVSLVDGPGPGGKGPSPADRDPSHPKGPPPTSPAATKTSSRLHDSPEKPSARPKGHSSAKTATKPRDASSNSPVPPTPRPVEKPTTAPKPAPPGVVDLPPQETERTKLLPLATIRGVVRTEPLKPGKSVGRETTAPLFSPGPPQSESPGSFEVPEVYKLRTAPDRARVARQEGGSPEVEAAVQAALAWLAANQEPDGRWNPARHGGGQETHESGRDRQGAGSHAETAVTGLAILAMTASGNTHRDGPHRATVRRAVQYLLQSQAADGNLGGQGAVYEFMYCHGMATFALGEVLGMTGDDRLREPLARAVAFTLAMQDPVGGGWRYRAHEPGDTSQFGWQLMALRSAELAGVPVPESAWQGAIRFLQSVSSGTQYGLASYRPGEQVSRTMTAEALACRQILRLAPDSPTSREAGDLIVAELPGAGTGNLYYWYYATMALHRLKGPYWKPWNTALQQTLLQTQQKSGSGGGSWDPNTRWDGYGGRVYATALASLCLEAYYRFYAVQAPSSAGPELPSTSGG
jgi:hypothetical protein